jgi:glutamyl-tRNA synthetase
MKIRTRFSPSPTGMIHLGNARAALYSAMYATKHHGVFILRIEDTDIERSEERYVEALQQDLQWMNVHWQEGPGVDGEYGPYWQSQRQPIYAQYYTVLEEKKLIYPCFCSEQELAIARKLQQSRGQAPRYSGNCKKLTQAEIDQRIQEGKKPAWRFAVPANQKIEFDDVVKGQQIFQSNDIGDFIIRRTDGSAPFLFCNAIDDAMMKVSHVLRGEDHVANTPRQIMIMNALSLPVPCYGHLSLIVGDDGAPLSKRHGSYSVRELNDTGYLPIAIVNYLARLGHTCEAQNLLPFEKLAEYFYLEKLSRSPARFDLTQLKYWQKIAVQSLDDANLWHWLGTKIQSQVPEDKQALFAATVRANLEFPQDALHWAKIFFHDHVAIEGSELDIIREAGEQFFVEAEQAVDKYGIDLQPLLADMKQTLGVSGKKLFMPLRIALTGKTYGPELAQIAELLGQEKMKLRFGSAFKVASEKTE